MAKTAKPKTDQLETTAAASADDVQAYIVTDTAPLRVAGRRVKAGDTIELSEEEARGELIALHIRPQASSEPTSTDV